MALRDRVSKQRALQLRTGEQVQAAFPAVARDASPVDAEEPLVLLFSKRVRGLYALWS
jgi:hypothetical protein